MSNLRLYILAGFLAAVGTAFFAYKVLFLKFPLQPDNTSSTYTIDARLFFSARSGKSIKARLMIPKQSNRFLILDENFVSHGYGLSTEALDDNRTAVWAARRATGDQYLFYRAVVQPIADPEPETTTEPPRAERPELSPTQLLAAKTLLTDAREHSADLDTFIAELAKELDTSKAVGAAGLLLEGSYTSLKKTQVAANVIALADIPVRIVHGLELKEQSRSSEPVHWLEVLEENTWRSFVIDAHKQELPESYFPWWRGGRSLYWVKNGENVQTSFDLKRNAEGGATSAISEMRIRHPLLFQFSLFSLPIDVQGVYRILLVLPLGALLVIFFRNIIGLQGFGTFMPVLIALAFRETNLFWGCLSLVLIVSAGLTARFALERLKLLLIPRLSAVLTIVILLIAMLSVLTHKLGLERGVSVALFPMVIITMVIERMSIVWDERGSVEAVKQGLGSLIIASAAFMAMSNKEAMHLFFVFPEINLVVLAIMLLLGRYTGYRLLELWRFRQLVIPEEQ